MRIFDLVLFFVLTLGIVLLGWYSGRRTTSAADYTHASGRVPGFVVGLSIFASYCSSISYLGYVSASYAGNWNQFVFTLTIPLAGFFAAWYFVPFYRRQNSISAYSYLQFRFGRWARVYASICYLFTQICRMATILYLLALPLKIVFDVDLSLIIVLTGIATLGFTHRGGMRTVIWIEALQGVILIAGAFICLLVIIEGLPGGFMQVLRTGWHEGKFSLGSFGLSPAESTFWVCLLYGIFTNLNNFGVDQGYTQRYHAAPNLHEARVSAVWGSFLPLPVNLLLFLIGTSIYTYYYCFPFAKPEHLGDDSIFPHFLFTHMPTGLFGLMLTCIFCAGMSTIATSITSSATLVMEDFLMPWHRRKHRELQFRKDVDHITSANLEEHHAIVRYNEEIAKVIDRHKIRMLRGSSVVITVLGICMALVFQMFESRALDSWWRLASLFSGGVLGLFLLGMSTRARRPQAVIATVAGVLTLAFIAFQTPILGSVGLSPVFHNNLAIVLSTAVILLVGWLLSLRLAPSKHKAR